MSGTVETNVFTLNKLYQLVVDGQIQYTGVATQALWGWGSNINGVLGQNDTIARSSPTQIPGTQWTQISSIGTDGLGALKSDGTLWVWGGNFGGSLGQNDTVRRSSPVQIPGTQWSQISGSSSSSWALARKSDNTLWAWGTNFWATLGLNDRVYRSSPVQVPGTQWADISAGADHAMARKSDGTLWTWGIGQNGSLGTGNAINRSSPVQVPGTQWVEICAGAISMARKSDNTLWTWGSNFGGVLGLNIACAINRSSPSQITGTAWTQIAGGRGGGTASASAARKSDGTLWVWGSNSSGVLGINDTVYRSSPVQIPGTQWADVVISQGGGFARKSDNTVWGWGSNFNGQLGINCFGSSFSSPVQVPGSQWSRMVHMINNSFARGTYTR